MEAGFEKATNQNLPTVDATMVFEYYQSNPDFSSAEIKNVKASRATREMYGDKAIGYVQIKRVNHICTMKSKVTPEHKVHNKGYNVILEIDEAEEKVILCKCMDCPASEGGCKHSIAFLLWVHRRSEEPSVTSVECYWKISKLSKVGSTVKFMKLVDICGKSVPSLPDADDSFLQEVMMEGENRCCKGTLFLKDFPNDPISLVSLHKLILKYKQDKIVYEADDFINYSINTTSQTTYEEVQYATKDQSKSSKWYEVRYGRITASKFYEAGRCKTLDGSLVESILGGSKVIETEAVTRGKILEDSVLEEFSRKNGERVEKCGIFLGKDHFIFGASPDGLTTTHVLEIKCPFKDKTILNYINSSGNINKKPYAQMQLQMLLTGRKKGYFCVAMPDFEATKNFKQIEILYDAAFTMQLLKDAQAFWKNFIFPKLIEI